MEIVTLIGKKVADYVLAATVDQLGYLFQYNDNIEKLKKQVGDLRDRRDMLQKKIKFAERNGEIIFTFVQNRLAEADGISAKAENFLEDEDKANKRCLRGWCINLRQRYRFSKEAEKHTSVISDQLQELVKFESVSYPAPPSGIISSSQVFHTGTFESRNLVKKQVMKALIDANNVNIIGICGMGGVGKTTLVKEIGQHVKEENKYDFVVMAVVSQTPNIMKIQGEIADMLGLKSLPTHSELARASSLWNRIKREEQILVILDDVWEVIKPDEIGIPFGIDHRGCKILITSRSRDVCNRMDCQKIFTIETLSKQESWELFSKIAGSIVENSEINSIAREVTTKCGGLPLAIVTIAGALKGKNKHVWSNAVRQLKMSTPSSIPEMERNVFSSLELSFNYLEERTKSLFLFCCLFPEDYYIRLQDLVKYWIGLRWFGGTHEAIEDVRNEVHAIVSILTSSFLLIEEGEKYVKLHDIIRDFAISIAHRSNHKFMVNAGIGLKEWPFRDTVEDFTCISLMANYIGELPNGLEYPNLQALLLQENKNLVVPSSFFEKMKNLKVLDLGRTYIRKLPDSISFLTNLRTLDISASNLVDLSEIVKLGKLEILNLSGSKLVDEIPSSFSQLTNLKLLNLNYMNLKLRIPHGVISSLQKLEELYISQFVRWESKNGSNANLVELEALSRLTSLHISIPSNLDLSSKLSTFQKLSNFILIIGHSPLSFNEYRFRKYSTKILYSRNMEILGTNISIIYNQLKGLFKRIESLTLENNADLDSISLDQIEEVFNELKYLSIRSCDKIRYLINTLESKPNSTFQDLEELHINENRCFVELCNGQPPAQSFINLKVLKVSMCMNLLNVAPNHLLQRFQNLQSLEVNGCRLLVYIFDCERLKIAKGETKLLSSLKYLDLLYLGAMSHIWKGDHQFISLHNLKRVYIVECSELMKLFSLTLLKSLICLEVIRIIRCHNLKEIFEMTEVEDPKIDHIITSPCLGNLTSVNIIGCHNLQILFTPLIAKCLVKLRSLELRTCSRIQEIISNEKEEKEKPIESIVFPSLYDLQLYNLDNLTCFSSVSYTIEFPNLEILKIFKIGKMKTFGYGKQVTPRLSKVVQGIDTERWNDNLNTTMQEIFNEQEQKATRGPT